jgi:nifR3 family TIM-barrel protein
MRFKNLEVASPLMLSPMAGYTILPFRVCVRALGGLSIATTDLVNARALLELNPKAIQMIVASSQDRPLGVQLFGANKNELSGAARFLEDLGIDLIDINMGCPSPKVNKSGAGAALMQDEELTEELVGTVVESVKIPVTVKMRLGWDEASINAHEIAPRLERIGVAAVAVHGRTKAQAFTGKVNLEGIRAVVRSVKSIPVIGNGDVHSPEDAKRMIQEIGCSGVMVGRAALGDPFFFRRTLDFLDGRTVPEVTLADRIRFMHYHFAVSLFYTGEEESCVQFRKVITGHTEFFPQKEKWRQAFQHLSGAEEYLQRVREHLPAGLPEFLKEPDLKNPASFLENGRFRLLADRR